MNKGAVLEQPSRKNCAYGALNKRWLSFGDANAYIKAEVDFLIPRRGGSYRLK